MSEMVERVAIAIHGKDGELGSWDSFDESYKAKKRATARAIIEAMREPTDEMCEEGAIYSDYSAAARGWGAMIDKALK